MFLRLISLMWYFIVGNICSLLIYKRNYIKGRYFKGKYLGLKGRGWRWAVEDFKARITLGVNWKVPFPISFANRINNYKNIHFDPNDLQIFQGNGKYFQAQDAHIYIGKGCHIANNVGIITTNHDICDPATHVEGKDVVLGEKCWIGVNSVVLPGVVLGPHTTVGAGAVVTKSFPEGYCVIAGNPAKIIRSISK